MTWIGWSCYDQGMDKLMNKIITALGSATPLKTLVRYFVFAALGVFVTMAPGILEAPDLHAVRAGLVSMTTAAVVAGLRAMGFGLVAMAQRYQDNHGNDTPDL